MQYGLYLFDFDGTLFDTRDSLLPIFRAGYAAVGRDVTPEEVEEWMHLNLNQSFALSGVDPSKFDIVMDAIISALDMPEALRLIKPFPEAREVLETLVLRGKKIGIVSNNTASHIRNVLEQLHFDMPVSCIVGSDIFTHGKPHPEPILTALSMLGLPADGESCYVGDSLQDEECGRNAGIDGILLDRENIHPDFMGKRIRSLTDLLA